MIFKKIKEQFNKRLSNWVYYPISRLWYPQRYSYVPDPMKIIWINVEDIYGWYRGNKYREITFPGQIKGGDWSRKVTPKDIMLQKSNKYQGVVEHFKQGLPWMETSLFKNHYALKLSENELKKKAEQYTATHDKLYHDLKNNGFKVPTKENIIAPIYICIGPEGEILWTVDGNHRLFMAMILEINKIPVMILKRHEKWQLIRDKVIAGKDEKLFSRFSKHPDIISEIN